MSAAHIVAPMPHQESLPLHNAVVLRVLRELHGGDPMSWHVGVERSRFWSDVRKSDGCWLWTGTITSGSYGIFRRDDGTRVRAHRYSYELEYGVAPAALFVCHTCDTPLCVRPDHLFLGTALDNVRDKVAKGRHIIDYAKVYAREMARFHVGEERA